MQKNFHRPTFLNSCVHRACSHDTPKNFVLPLLEHHRLVGSCLVITRQRTGTTAILVVSERVGARLWNIRSRKNTKCFADYSRCIDDSTSARRLQIRYCQSNLDPKGDHLFTSIYIEVVLQRSTKSILSATTYTEFLIFVVSFFACNRSNIRSIGTP